MRHESARVMKFSTLNACWIPHCRHTALCVAWWSGSVPVCAESQEKAHSDWMPLVNVPSQSPFPCLLFSAVTARYHWQCHFNSITPLLLWPCDERGWCWVTAGYNILCWDIVFGARALDWPRGWNSNGLLFLEEVILQVHKRQQCVCIRSSCLPAVQKVLFLMLPMEQKHTYGNHRMWFLKKGADS